MRFRITHQTDYTYESSVSVGHYAAHLAPRRLPSQECPWHEIIVSPKPAERAVRVDSFGNSVTYFEVTGLHHKLSVVSRSLVEIRPLDPLPPLSTPPWETVREWAAGDQFDATSTAQEFVFASPLIQPGAEFAAYAAPSFPPQRTVLDGVCDLNHRIFTDFAFDPAATDVATQVDKAFRQRRGVCQDFAQVMIACLRSVGLPARYVSGYLETLPPPGKEKLIGADASHAWASVWCGAAAGWVDVDPTNDLLPSSRHITVAWGRDFSDISPLRGVMQGAGEQTLHVSVDVQQEIEACA
ncbi:MAG TPA: transglutaminase family protein [Verrucomicrobiaceae bacterium]|jgi:transglutaminase-like putative cysteine protease